MSCQTVRAVACWPHSSSQRLSRRIAVSCCAMLRPQRLRALRAGPARGRRQEATLPCEDLRRAPAAAPDREPGPRLLLLDLAVGLRGRRRRRGRRGRHAAPEGDDREEQEPEQREVDHSRTPRSCRTRARAAGASASSASRYTRSSACCCSARVGFTRPLSTWARTSSSTVKPACCARAASARSWAALVVTV